MNLEIDELIQLKNLIVTKEGELLINFLSDYVTQNACLKREASEIKGMAELLHQIKSIPDLVRQKGR